MGRGGAKDKTSVQKDGGSRAQWPESFEFSLEVRCHRLFRAGRSVKVVRVAGDQDEFLRMREQILAASSGVGTWSVRRG